jgi:hypothetical protein
MVVSGPPLPVKTQPAAVQQSGDCATSFICKGIEPVRKSGPELAMSVSVAAAGVMAKFMQRI